MLIATLVLPARDARAVNYEIPIDVETEDDLQELFITGQIREDTWNTLVELMRRGVNLDTAGREELYQLPNLTYDDVDRILAYREEAGRIHDPADLVVAGALPREQVEAIAPFLRTGDAVSPLAAVTGRVRYQLVASPVDGTAPSMALQARLTTLRYLTLGVAGVVTRQRLGEVRYDPSRGALAAEPVSTQFHVPKVFASWEGEHGRAILGSYRIGFGQRLTFDNTDRFTPNGYYLDDAIFWDPGMGLRCRETDGELSAGPCDGPDGGRRITNDLRWRDGLFGVAGGVDHLSVGDGWIQAIGFASYLRRDLGQFEVYDREACDDPRNDGDPACDAVDTFRRQSDSLAPTSRYLSSTLPDIFAEARGGANLSYFHDRRTHVGVTGWGGRSIFLAEGIDLDFQEWSTRPFGDAPYGAVGVDASYGAGWADVFFEASRSFDGQVDGGGGYAAIARGTATFDGHEIELTGRYYGEDYANPYAGSISAPDERDGNRARDEAGGRIRYTGVIADRLSLRAAADFWTQPSQGLPKADIFVRADVQVIDAMRLGLWVDYDSRNLAEHGRDNCFSGTEGNDDQGEPLPCEGEQIRLTPRARFELGRNASLQTQATFSWVDDGTSAFADRFRRDLTAFALLQARPLPAMRIRARARFLFQDIDDRGRMEQSLWWYVAVNHRFASRTSLGFRYDVYHYLDTRESTALRDPQPEHWGRLEIIQRY